MTLSMRNMGRGASPPLSLMDRIGPRLTPPPWHRFRPAPGHRPRPAARACSSSGAGSRMAKLMPFIWLAPGRHQRVQRGAQLGDILQPHRDLIADLIAGQAARAVVFAIGILRRDREIGGLDILVRHAHFFQRRKDRLHRALLAASAGAAVAALVVTPAGPSPCRGRPAPRHGPLPKSSADPPQRRG